MVPKSIVLKLGFGVVVFGMIWWFISAIQHNLDNFICNLNDIEYIKPHEISYYADNDIFDLSYQHGCYRVYAIRKGAKKSPEKMITILSNHISKLEHEIDWNKMQIESMKQKIEKIKSGNLDVYI